MFYYDTSFFFRYFLRRRPSYCFTAPPFGLHSIFHFFEPLHLPATSFHPVPVPIVPTIWKKVLLFLGLLGFFLLSPFELVAWASGSKPTTFQPCYCTCFWCVSCGGPYYTLFDVFQKKKDPLWVRCGPVINQTHRGRSFLPSLDPARRPPFLAARIYEPCLIPLKSTVFCEEFCGPVILTLGWSNSSLSIRCWQNNSKEDCVVIIRQHLVARFHYFNTFYPAKN